MRVVGTNKYDFEYQSSLGKPLDCHHESYAVYTGLNERKELGSGQNQSTLLCNPPNTTGEEVASPHGASSPTLCFHASFLLNEFMGTGLFLPLRDFSHDFPIYNAKLPVRLYRGSATHGIMFTPRLQS